ncbi:MAG: hypothetical protein E5X83_18960 [Mesorhizobium sp.]|nr:MAG: hypothetical protein E5X83_18960 [Mesorhizobium sp.]
MAAEIGCTAQTLNERLKNAEVDSGVRAVRPTEVAEELKARSGRTRSCVRPTKSCARHPPTLRRRNSTAGSSHDRVHRRSPGGAWGRADLQGAADRPRRLCRTIPPGCRRGRSATTRSRSRCGAYSRRTVRVYGVRKVCRQLRRDGFDVPRCSVSLLMREMGLEGAIRSEPVRTTVNDKAAPCPLDQVNRQFHAPGAKLAAGLGLHLCRDPACFVYCRLRHRRLCPVASSASGRARPPMRASFSVPWNKYSMIGPPESSAQSPRPCELDGGERLQGTVRQLTKCGP